ncbi:MAG TPA: hypothetical protein VMV86_00285 [Methanosarcinales archaeon]|nr:hypothetical protein [Methanosarcinales archaeon]
MTIRDLKTTINRALSNGLITLDTPVFIEMFDTERVKPTWHVETGNKKQHAFLFEPEYAGVMILTFNEPKQ